MRNIVAALTVLFLVVSTFAQVNPPARELTLEFEPSQTTAKITLAATMHTVEGEFAFKRGAIHYDPATGKASGEVAFDATSGKTGSGSRDHKMHDVVLQSQQYPEIVFRPDHAQGTLPSSGASTMQVHGVFAIHGAEHELTVPVEVSFTGDGWTAKASFPVPYVKWGMKNPSVLLLRVEDTVQVSIHAAGNLAR